MILSQKCPWIVCPRDTENERRVAPNELGSEIGREGVARSRVDGQNFEASSQHIKEK